MAELKRPVVDEVKNYITPGGYRRLQDEPHLPGGMQGEQRSRWKRKPGEIDENVEIECCHDACCGIRRRCERLGREKRRRRIGRREQRAFDACVESRFRERRAKRLDLGAVPHAENADSHDIARSPPRPQERYGRTMKRAARLRVALGKTRRLAHAPERIRR